MHNPPVRPLDFPDQTFSYVLVGCVGLDYTTKKMLSKTASLPSKNVILEALLDEMEAIP